MLPETMKRNLLMNNLRPALRDQVIHSIPLTLEDAIKNATFLEEQALGISGEQIKQSEQLHVRMFTSQAMPPPNVNKSNVAKHSQGSQAEV